MEADILAATVVIKVRTKHLLIRLLPPSTKKIKSTRIKSTSRNMVSTPATIITVVMEEEALLLAVDVSAASLFVAFLASSVAAAKIRST